jgi:multidrug efflux system outer membrane protein
MREPTRLGLCRRHLVLITALSVVGCAAVGPDYQRPEVPVPAQWRLADGEGTAIANAGWWKQFQDPALDQLVDTALHENKDLKIASARIEEYLGRYAFTRADQFPQIGAEAGGERARTPEAGTTGVVGGTTSNIYQIGGLLSFELDLFGRLRRATEAARANLLATEEGRRTVILALVSAVASNYIQLRSLDQQLSIALSTLNTRKESVRIAKARFGVGLTSELDVSQAEAEYQATAVQIPQLEISVAQREDAISLLLGRNPEAIARGRSLDQLAQPPIPGGLPSALLEQRPDIRLAEDQLIAANADIGVAKAAYFPVISLTGLLGYVSPELDELFQGSSRTWNYGLGLTVPIFTAGKIGGQVQAAEAVQQELVGNYEKTIQTAFAEVDDSLIAVRKGNERLQAQRAQLAALGRYLQLAKLRYDNGYTSYLEVVDAERNLFNAQVAYAQTQGDVLQSLVGLYKAMGGGWVEDAEKTLTAEGSPPPA